jgi:hypothetical protein
MENRTTVNGLVILAAGLLAESASTLLGHITILGSATDFTRGLLDGLAVVAFGAAIFVLSRSVRTGKP